MDEVSTESAGAVLGEAPGGELPEMEARGDGHEDAGKEDQALAAGESTRAGGEAEAVAEGGPGIAEAEVTTVQQVVEPEAELDPMPGPEVTPDPALLIGVIVAVIIGIFFAYAMRRQRRIRREELRRAEEGELEETEAPHPPEASLEPPSPGVAPTPPIEEGPPASPEAALAAREREETAKEKRRREFIEEQRKRREERDRHEADRLAAERAVEEEVARKAAEEAERREAEEAARREALLASSGPLTDRLSKTRGGFVGRLNALLGKKIDEDTLEEIEEVLFTADIGVKTAEDLLETVRGSLKKTQLGDQGMVLDTLKSHIVEKLGKNGAKPGQEAIDPDAAEKRPLVIMVIGVNGVGKTTTIGKLAGRYVARGKKVVLAAGDTFRAAAVEQLEVWADRVGCEVVRGAEGADPGSVTFDAVRRGVAEGADAVIVDTAGRLHTKVPLMEELTKVHRVLGKAREGAPDEVLLVVDATTGQNALQQARMFREAVPVTSIALTKLDGTAKGGVVIGITGELDLPVRYIGVGEKVGDLRPFEPEEFVEALFGQEG